jgi:hypothetical protein
MESLDIYLLVRGRLVEKSINPTRYISIIGDGDFHHETCTLHLDDLDIHQLRSNVLICSAQSQESGERRVSKTLSTRVQNQGIILLPLNTARIITIDAKSGL